MAGIAFLAGTAWHDLQTDDERVVVKEKVKTVEVEVLVTPEPQPQPTVTKLITPESCGMLPSVVEQALKHINTSSAAQSKLPELISKAGIHITARDVPALAQVDQELRTLKGIIDTSNIEAVEVITSLTNALEQCRQELQP